MLTERRRSLLSGVVSHLCLGFSSGKKNNAFVSPNRVKESLDLYEELITEEQEEKDTTYNEVLILLFFVVVKASFVFTHDDDNKFDFRSNFS